MVCHWLRQSQGDTFRQIHRCNYTRHTCHPVLPQRYVARDGKLVAAVVTALAAATSIFNRIPLFPNPQTEWRLCGKTKACHTSPSISHFISSNGDMDNQQKNKACAMDNLFVFQRASHYKRNMPKRTAWSNSTLLALSRTPCPARPKEQTLKKNRKTPTKRKAKKREYLADDQTF